MTIKMSTFIYKYGYVCEPQMWVPGTELWLYGRPSSVFLVSVQNCVFRPSYSFLEQLLCMQLHILRLDITVFECIFSMGLLFKPLSLPKMSLTCNHVKGMMWAWFSVLAVRETTIQSKCLRARFFFFFKLTSIPRKRAHTLFFLNYVCYR